MQPTSTSIGENADRDALRRHLLRLIVQREALRRTRDPAAVERVVGRDPHFRPVAERGQ